MAIRKTWVVIADQKKASLYEVDNREYRLNFISSLRNDFDERMAGLKEKGSVSKQSRQSNVRALVNENSLKRRMVTSYVDQLAEEIESGRKAGAFSKIIMAAGPELMGLLRAKLSRPTLGMIQREITKDYTSLKQAEVMDIISHDVRDSFISA